MKLKEGKIYQMRNGHITDPLERLPKSELPYKFTDGFTLRWEEDGLIKSDCVSDLDLVTEYKEGEK